MLYLPQILRECSKCHEWKPLTKEFFHRSVDNSGGFVYRCRKCLSHPKKPKYAPDATSKICCECGKDAPFAELKPDNGCPFGVSNICKKCWKIQYDKWKADNREHVNEYARNFYRDNIELVKEWARASRQRHPDRVSARHALWRENNAEYIREKYRPARRQAANSEKGRARKLRRRARKAGLPHDFTGKDWHRALDYWHGCCAVCGRPPGLWHKIAADHWIAITDLRPGNPGTVVENILPLCNGIDGCNTLKWKKDPVEWLNAHLGPRKAKAKLREIEAYFEWAKIQKHG